MKLTYLLIVIALLASSCNSDATNDIISKGAELTFDVSGLSRSSVTTDINHFVVFGDTKPQKDGTSTPIVVFDKTNVEYKNDGWYYNGTQYWIHNYEHSFVAVSPAAIFETGTAPRYLNSQLSFDYSIPTSGNAADILTATHRRLYVNNGTLDNRITFTFRHLLSLINIAPAFSDNNMSNEEYLLFHKLEILGVNSKTHVDIMPAPRLTGSSTYDMEFDITPQEDREDYSFDFPTPVKVKNNAGNVRLFADNDAIIMLPQAFADDSDAEITLSYTINGDTSINYVRIPLKNLKWESGRSYIYKFTIERSGVIFDTCEINPWNIVPGGEIEITVD